MARLRKGEPRLIYFLLEHQSTADGVMPLRVLGYQQKVWERFRKAHPRARLPPIVAVLVSHVEGGWTEARSAEVLFDPAVLAIPGLAALVPRCSMIVDDLALASNADLAARALGAPQQLALWLLRDGRAPARLLDNFDTWSPVLAGAGTEHLRVLIRPFAPQPRWGSSRCHFAGSWLLRAATPVGIPRARPRATGT